MSSKNKQVLVGVSGGVDSAVSVSILQKEGWDVHAAFIFFSPKESGGLSGGFEDAKQVCAKLKIPLIEIEAGKLFDQEVVGYFLREYSQGKTPNPCIYCNERVKFRLLLEEADKLGINYVATGHYARNIKRVIFTEGKERTIFGLFSGKESAKDQSYFLYRLKQKELGRTIFPLGEYAKSATRNLAKTLGLVVCDKPDSQNVCFLQKNSLRTFFRDKLDLKTGDLVDVTGRVLGQHRGLPLYTIGQRKGLDIGGSGPFFVVQKDLKRNRIVVTDDSDDKRLEQGRIRLKNISWVGVKPVLPLKTNVRIRYRNPLHSAIIKQDKEGRELIVDFKKAQKFVSAGQSAVFYSEFGEVLGGGIIK